jgi:tetratricopeptide (TPR) repeat protein
MGERMQKKKKRQIGFKDLIVTGIFLVFLTGCSTTQGMFNWLPLSDYANIKPGISKQDIKKFGFYIRPASGNPDSHYLLAKYYQKRGRHKEAIVELEKTISINSSYVKAYNRLGISYDKLGDFPRAVHYYKNALALNPELDYVHNNLGYSYILQGKYDKAIKVLNEAVELNKREKLYHNNLRLAYAKNDKFEKTTDEIRVAGNREATHSNFRRMLPGRDLAFEAEKDSSHDVSFERSFETIDSSIDSTKAMHEEKQYSITTKIISIIKERLKLAFGKVVYGLGLESPKIAFGKPIYGPGLRQESPKIAFGKPIYGPGLRQERPKIVFDEAIYGLGLTLTDEVQTSERQMFYDYM